MKTQQNSKVATLAKLSVLTATIALSGVAMANDTTPARARHVDHNVNQQPAANAVAVRFNLIDGQPVR